MVTEPEAADAVSTPTLQSFFLGGFECATHLRRDRTRIDVTHRTRHDACCAEDYQLLAQLGIRTVRDGLRWHLIEREPGVYDWSSFLPMLDAALRTNTQVIWDLCHWGVPDGLDPFTPAFGERFAAFASAAAELIQQRSRQAGHHAPPLFCAINEMSFWAWVGGDEQHFFPYGKARANELKRSLVAASVLGMRAVRRVVPGAQFVQPEPIINIVADRAKPEDREFTTRYTEAQYEVWDMLTGRLAPELEGSPELLDVVGVNYYWNNQWVHKGDRVPPGHGQHRPLHLMLLDLWERYRKPILITETGAEGGAAAGWLGYVSAEVRQAMRQGAEILGICLYPVMDYPGWDDDRHCPCGLIQSSPDWATRSLRDDLAAELHIQQTYFEMARTGVR